MPVLKAGILIIGSLLWDDAGREDWRRRRLCLESRQQVQVHTRYGRLSQSRNHTYTMVFSKSAAPSTAVVAPCRKSIRAAEDLFEEAGHLATAEGLADKAKWLSFGAVGILITRSSPSAADLLPSWSEYFRDHLNGKCEATRKGAPGESPSLGEDGLLNVVWPINKRLGAPNDCDVLLATANAPDLNADRTYPSPRQIAQRFLDSQYITYFSQNVRHGIFTADDSAIWQYIKAARPSWIEPAEAEEIESAIHQSRDAAF